MKTLIASLFAFAMLGAGAGAANADIVGVHVGPVHVGSASIITTIIAIITVAIAGD